MILNSIAVQAACPGTNPSLHQQYICKRFVTIDYAGAKHRIDFNQVQTVIQDTHNHAKLSLTPAPTWAPNAGHYFVVFNNGTWLFFSESASNPKPADAWDAYRDFLIENPSFMGMR